MIIIIENIEKGEMSLITLDTHIPVEVVARGIENVIFGKDHIITLKDAVIF